MSKKTAIEDIRQALYASKIISYAQGYMLLRQVSEHYKWKLNFGGIALMWRGGCIIRSRFLGDIKAAYDRNPELSNLLLDPFFTTALKKAQDGWRRTVALGATLGIPTPTFSNALSFYDSYRSARLPANLLQAQRDYFGAHTYERIDKPRKEFFHTNWTGQGGTTASSTYNALKRVLFLPALHDRKPTLCPSSLPDPHCPTHDRLRTTPTPAHRGGDLWRHGRSHASQNRSCVLSPGKK